MLKESFIEKTFDPLEQKYTEQSHTDEYKESIKKEYIQALDNISSELEDLNFPNPKFIAFSLLRLQVMEQNKFIYTIKVFDDVFENYKELGEYHAYWLTEKYIDFLHELNQRLKKTMLKNDPIFVTELRSRIVEHYNYSFVHSTKEFLENHKNTALGDHIVIAGDYIFAPVCLGLAQFEIVKEF